MYNVQFTIYKASYQLLYKFISPYGSLNVVPNSVKPFY